MRSRQRNLHFFTMVSFLLMPSSPAAGVQIRLSGSGSTQCSGRVEIYHNNIWGTVCDDSWDLNDTMVVCRELNCGTALDATQSAQFGEGTGQIWLDDVACSGNEWSLTECQHNGFGNNNCGHSEDAGVICSVHLQTPSISLTSPDGGLVLSPEAAQVTRGSSFVITCSINSSYPDSRFFLISSGSSVTSKSAVDHSASFNFPVAEYKHQGNYSCVYEVTLSTWKFNSTETESISVIIKLPLLLLVTSVAVGALLLALLVLLVVCLVCRRRRRAKKPATLICMAVTDNDDDDQDYVNVDQMDTKKKVKENVGKVEEEENDDYENPESDEDHDYEEVGPDESNTEDKKICFSVKDCRDDEKTLKEESVRVEEEESDDYENPESDEDHDYEEAGPAENNTEDKKICFSVKDCRDDEKTLKEKVGKAEEEESDDYENPESDEDHDYDEAGPAENNTEAKEVYRDSEVVDDNEESETSDDEDDYVNVNVPLCEQTNVNIYREN
ncbi:scavenger receptor cysteine-rich type 1 protein M130-like isoform X2 [Anabas testudineus]|uniref:scavenger receptor cysteine-rich type 1 protein M130-like isoform X2 n=1 Tax=Anabas testudineus TaxID=64144 RepID=UPI000E4634B4|nr:scavenger receptor cysteine-rich type 1 protein M130-like isoform X2 [Anabas testudineus]